MHELSIAMSLLDVITEKLIQENASSARSITIEVGELSGVVPQALQTAFKTASRGTELADCQLTVIPVRAEIWCRSCNAACPAHAANDLRCARCNTPADRLIRGRELDVVSIAIVDAD